MCPGQINMCSLEVTDGFTPPFLSCTQKNYSTVVTISHLAELLRLSVSFWQSLIAVVAADLRDRITSGDEMTNGRLTGINNNTIQYPKGQNELKKRFDPF